MCLLYCVFNGEGYSCTTGDCTHCCFNGLVLLFLLYLATRQFRSDKKESSNMKTKPQLLLVLTK